MSLIIYPFDPSGTNPVNLVGVGTPEVHTVNANNNNPKINYILPVAAPYFSDSLKVYNGVGMGRTLLTQGVDYMLLFYFSAATWNLGLPVYGGIGIIDQSFSGTISLEYQTLGGDWTLDDVSIVQSLVDAIYNPRLVYWDQVANLPYAFPPGPHTQNINTFKKWDDLITEVTAMKDAIVSWNSDPAGLRAALSDHIANGSAHPSSAVGLGNVPNYGMATLGEAQAGLVANKLMSPYLVAAYVGSLVVSSANKLTTARTITLTGGATGSGSFDGSADISIAVTIPGLSPAWSAITSIPSAVTDVAGLNLAHDQYLLHISSGHVDLIQPSALSFTAAQISDFTSAVDALLPDLTVKADKTTTITGGGLANGGGSLGANRVITVTASNDAQAIAGTDTSTAMTPESTAAALAAKALGPFVGYGAKVYGYCNGATSVTCSVGQILVADTSGNTRVISNKTGVCSFSTVGYGGLSSVPLGANGHYDLSVYIIDGPSGTDFYGIDTTGAVAPEYMSSGLPAGYTASALLVTIPITQFTGYITTVSSLGIVFRDRHVTFASVDVGALADNQFTLANINLSQIVPYGTLAIDYQSQIIHNASYSGTSASTLVVATGYFAAPSGPGAWRRLYNSALAFAIADLQVDNVPLTVPQQISYSTSTVDAANTIHSVGINGYHF